jgi:hypothetical protein
MVCLGVERMTGAKYVLPFAAVVAVLAIVWDLVPH